MNLYLHLFIHISLALLAGFIVYKITGKKIISFFFSFLSGVAVDFDHFIDYFLDFRWNFHLEYFKNGYEFVKTGRIFLLFHGWEYVAVLLVLFLVVRKVYLQAIFLGLALGLFFHLVTDVIVDDVPITFYSVVYRVENNFEVKNLVGTRNYERYLKQKEEIKFN
jgi:hypothetical protein